MGKSIQVVDNVMHINQYHPPLGVILSIHIRLV